ncbi:hypothetical protein GCM10010441_12630 [Kitasatospora paracochleata]|uniref:PIN domain-containing protein n=1 Tax=Kitasatospora paracochleata TaxID=58354 RepID=A0ABT1ITS8_9ACTN|nr:hypothetical protein [Kitasatospora paracochleata]MCP2308540.1 hypothetical protein [Kitasatospora paracochleata]
MDERFAEYCDVGVADPLRQGDVLEAVDAEATMWKRHLLVMTADCDFAHAKHRGRVTCVPLLTAEEYLAEMQIPKVRDQLVKPQMAELRRILASGQMPTISDRRLREWASEEKAEAIVRRLGLDGANSKKASDALEAIRMLDTPAKSLRSGIELLVKAQLAGASPPKPEGALKKVVGKLREPYSQPPGDALFLASIGPGLDAGFFAYLRHIEQVWEPEISLGPSRAPSTYRRISRMRDRFAHALVQRFAMVFMSIGLPQQYEELRDLHAAILGESLS